MIDILAFGIHPDDVELSCGGTLLKHISAGYSVGIIDLTKGELGTRGNPELRLQEATAAAKILGITFRENIGLADCFFKNDRESQYKIIEKIREYQPKIVICNAISDRHPDHARAAQLISDACFYSGLLKIETSFNKKIQAIHRPNVIYHYIQDKQLKPDFVVDVTGFVDVKMEAIKAYSSQFFNPNSKEPITPISTEAFLECIKSNMRVFGRSIGVDFAEGFTVERCIGVDDLFSIK